MPTFKKNKELNGGRRGCTVLLHSTNVQNSKMHSTEKLSCIEVFQEVQRACRKHLVCTNSLLSSVQAFIMSATLLLQKLHVKEFSVLIGGAMIDDVGLNPYAH